MKKIVLLLCLFGVGLLFIVGFQIIKITRNKPDVVVKNVPEVKIVPKLKVVFVVSDKNIDFNKMAIDEIIDEIQKDSILQIKKLSPEIYLKPQIIKVYRIEDITCPYLKKRFILNNPGELVYEYNDKILIKLKDGVIKVYHSHINKI